MSDSVINAPVPVLAPKLLATPPGPPGTSRLTDMAEAAVADGETGNAAQLLPSRGIMKYTVDFGETYSPSERWLECGQGAH